MPKGTAAHPVENTAHSAKYERCTVRELHPLEAQAFAGGVAAQIAHRRFRGSTVEFSLSFGGSASGPTNAQAAMSR